MFSVDEKNKITITRGDTARFRVSVSDVLGNSFNLLPTDRMVFSVKRRYTDEKCVIQKEIPLDTQILTINPTDTKPLQMGKTYVYDISITRNNGDVYTIIPRKEDRKAKIKIAEEVG